MCKHITIKVDNCTNLIRRGRRGCGRGPRVHDDGVRRHRRGHEPLQQRVDTRVRVSRLRARDQTVDGGRVAHGERGGRRRVRGGRRGRRRAVGSAPAAQRQVHAYPTVCHQLIGAEFVRYKKHMKSSVSCFFF